MLTHSSRRSLIGAVFAAVLALSCSDSAAVNPFGDLNLPSVTLSSLPSVDSVVAFKADVSDNLGIKTVSISVTGGVSASFDTTFTFAVTSTSLTYAVPVPSSVAPGTAVVITAVAMDGAGNQSPQAILVVGVGNISPSVVLITSPPNGTIAVIGKSILVSISAKAATKVRSIGFRTAGVVTVTDSSVFSSPLKDSVAVLDTLTIPSDAPTGTITLIPFLIDSLAQRTEGPSITINVQSPSTTTAIPTVNFGIARRIEVRDTINVFASDPSGITNIGYEIRLAAGGPVTTGDSATGSGSFTTLSQRFDFDLSTSLSTPATIYVKAFAVNSNGTRAYARLASGDDRVDTVVVVAGETTALPNGGRIADALYHPGRDRLYLTNIERNRVEVFSLGLGGFESSIPTGSRPWGIAAWPLDRDGTMSDRLLVANSGGTSISYLNAVTSAHDSIYTLPNIVAYSVTSTQSTSGFAMQQKTKYDFSDRPQYLATTCRVAGNVCVEVILVYSTTPTGGQSVPFPNQGTVRWENLTTRQSHLFFEQAVGQTAGRADTLEVVRYKAFDEVGPDSTVLVPYRNFLKNGADSLPYSVVVDLPKLAFRDTTFVRNSGNFARAMLGEGGSVAGSRAMIYTVDAGMVNAIDIDGTVWTFKTPVLDGGISRAADVSDYIGNTFARVRGVALNFDGRLGAIRGDSTYLLDPTLRLQGLLQTSGGNPGFDFHPRNSGNPNVPMVACYAFAASTEPVIQVFENRHYSLVDAIPVKEPIVGPIKAALRPTGEIVLVGATASGVVVVRLPNTFSGCP